MGRVTHRKADFHRRVADIVDRFQLRRTRNEVATTAETFATDADVAAIAAFAATLGTAAGLDFDTDPTFAEDSDELLPTQAAVIDYLADRAAALFGYTARAFCQLLSAPCVLGRVTTQQTVGAVTTETKLGSILVPGGSTGANGFLRIYSGWDTSSDAFTKTLRIRLHTSDAVGGTTIYSVAHTAVNQRRCTDLRHVIMQNSQNSQRYHGAANAFASALATASSTAALDFSGDIYVIFTGQKSDASATVSLSECYAEQLAAA